MSILTLDEATPETSGNKASTLATLRRAGIDVPDGFVVPFGEYRRHHEAPLGPTSPQPDADLVDAIDAHLTLLAGRAGEGYVAVRSSASDEDGSQSSSAGQHDTVLAVRGPEAVAEAVARCWASLHSPRATAYRGTHPDRGTPPAMAVLVQQLVDADVSGVLFTRTPRVVEATPGLGALLVNGQVTPDAWTLDDTGIIARRLGTAGQRLDRHGEELLATPLPTGPSSGSRAASTAGSPAAPTAEPSTPPPAAARGTGPMCLTDASVLELDRLGQAISETLGYDADIEWALTNGRFRILQARPITASVSLPHAESHGIPASPGRAVGTTCVLRGPRDFHRFQPGDIIVCRATDPAWTPLFSHAAGILTETGGLLSHAAIVAREIGIPAILSVLDATTRFPSGTHVTMDGTTGHIQT